MTLAFRAATWLSAASRLPVNTARVFVSDVTADVAARSDDVVASSAELHVDSKPESIVREPWQSASASSTDDNVPLRDCTSSCSCWSELLDWDWHVVSCVRTLAKLDCSAETLADSCVCAARAAARDALQAVAAVALPER